MATSKTNCITDLMTIEEAAARMGCSGGTIWRWVRAGVVNSHRLWARTLLERAEIEQLANDREIRK